MHKHVLERSARFFFLCSLFLFVFLSLSSYYSIYAILNYNQYFMFTFFSLCSQNARHDFVSFLSISIAFALLSIQTVFFRWFIDLVVLIRCWCMCWVREWNRCMCRSQSDSNTNNYRKKKQQMAFTFHNSILTFSSICHAGGRPVILRAQREWVRHSTLLPFSNFNYWRKTRRKKDSIKPQCVFWFIKTRRVFSFIKIRSTDWSICIFGTEREIEKSNWIFFPGRICLIKIKRRTHSYRHIS